eukprot:scaffold307872_cov27-Tisochrysis_lutea.AAC.1
MRDGNLVLARLRVCEFDQIRAVPLVFYALLDSGLTTNCNLEGGAPAAQLSARRIGSVDREVGLHLQRRGGKNERRREGGSSEREKERGVGEEGGGGDSTLKRERVANGRTRE